MKICFPISAGLRRLNPARPSVLIAFTLLLACHSLFAQGPVFRREYGLTLAYEDVSDIFRRFPGMYPYDYGTIGSPVIFRPWGLNPWEVRYNKDGILQNRISDGLYDSNLQPFSELDSVKYDLLRGDAAGQVEMWSRTVPADSPYTEIQVREGFYNYGTVELAHGQRLYKNSMFELTGRLVWYDGMRPYTNSKFNRLRGRATIPLGKQWWSKWTYAGSSVDFNSPIRIGGGYTEREEFIANAVRTDSMVRKLRPEFNLFVRRDRENWGSAFRLRETVYGWTAGVSKRVGRNAWWVRNEGYMADVKYPGIADHRVSRIELIAGDSVKWKKLALITEVSAHRESKLNLQGFPGFDTPRYQNELLGEGHAKLQFEISHNISLFGGAGMTRRHAPEAWYNTTYTIADRPIPISQAFFDTSQTVVPALFFGQDIIESTFKGEVGSALSGNSSSLRVSLLGLVPQSTIFRPAISTSDGVSTSITRPDDAVGIHSTGKLKLFSGLELQESWFLQLDDVTITRAIEQRGYSRLYFERDFFTAPLTIRSHISYEHIGTRLGYSDKFPEGVVLRPAHVFGFRMSAQIHGITLIWGTENLFKEHYSLMPGYPMIGKEEYLGLQWRLWM